MVHVGQLYYQNIITLIVIGAGLLVQDPKISFSNISKLKIRFRNLPHFLSSILSKDEVCPPCSLPILGKPLIVYNVEKILSANISIKSISMPQGLSGVIDLLGSNFPSLQVDEYDENDENLKDNKLKKDTDELEIPLLSHIEIENKRIRFNQITYPWDFLYMINHVLKSEVKNCLISKNTSIGKSSIIVGPCIIQDNVNIDDFCKISGPVFIGKDTKIGTSSLVRGSMIEKNCEIGFNCEVARSYVERNSIISHQDEILDTLVGRNVWFAAYVGTANVLFERKNIKYKIGNELIDTGLTNFGAVIGHDSMIGVGVAIYPGRYIPPNTTVEARTVVAH